jgi:hypothetical protein
MKKLKNTLFAQLLIILMISSCSDDSNDETLNTVNLAVGASTSASSTFSGYLASKINDGNKSTTLGGDDSWTNNHNPSASVTLPQWVELDFGKSISFSKVVLYTSEGYEIQDYKIQYFDSQNWITVTDIVGNTLVERTHSFSKVTGEKLRVYGTKGPSVQTIYVRVNELEVY